MRIDILTVVPELLTSPLNESILHRAQEKGLVRIVVHNLHDYAHDRRKTTDDYPFGGEAGMVMKCEPVFELVEKLQSERPYDEIIYTSPDGIRYDQHEANRLSTLENIIILCGHYKGIDHRIREHLVTREISIGDYVLTGGELAACIIADSVVRIIPAPSATKPRRSPTRSRTTCWRRRSTRARPSSAAGGFPTCCSRATSPRSPGGRTNSPSNAPGSCGPTCSANKRMP